MATADFQRVGVNRHRGLRVEQLTRRYLRLRHGDDAAEGCQVCGGHDTSCCEDRWAYDDERDDGVDPEVVLGAWREGARYAAGRPRIADRLPAALRGRGPGEWTAAPRQKAEEGGAPLLLLGEAAAELPAALHEHVGRLRAELNPLDYIQSAGCQRALRELSEQLPDREASFAIFSAHAGALGTALLFRRFWIRPLRTFAPPGERGGVALIAALVEHLFARYPVPGFLLRAWSGSSLPDFKWVCWTILLGQGGSLHAAARRFGWALGRGVIARLHEAPADLDPVAACMWAEIAHLGGGRIELERLRGDPAFTIDPTGPTAQEEEGERFARRADFLPFWRQTVAWLIRYRDQLTEEGCRLILAWAMHRFTEGPRFSWSGRTPKGAEAAARAYEEERLLPYARRFWARKGWDREVLFGGRTWTVIELISGRELYEEGRAMHHCVSGYAHRCAAGWAAIFSLREEGWRRVTVEITVPERRVVQARGACNRAATSEEKDVLQRWLRAISGPTGGGPCAS